MFAKVMFTNGRRFLFVSVNAFVFISRKLNEDLKVREVKPATVNQQCVVYKFQCNLCDAGYVGYTRGHLHERVDGHTIYDLTKYLIQ